MTSKAPPMAAKAPQTGKSVHEAIRQPRTNRSLPTPAAAVFLSDVMALFRQESAAGVFLREREGME